MNIADKLVRERRARLAAERLLEQKSRELTEANQRLAGHAKLLSAQVIEQRRGLEQANSEKLELSQRNSAIEGDLLRERNVSRQAQRRLWEALETIPDGFAVFDPDLRLVIANGAFVALFAGRGALGAGTSYDQVLIMLVEQGIVDLAGAARDDWYFEMIARLQRREIPARTVRLASGRHLRFLERWGDTGDLVCLTADVTDEVGRASELELARQKAEAASRAKSAFLANMSHELRTPMNGVVGMAELLCETTLSEEQRVFAETIRSSGETLLTIINDVLDYSKAEAEKLKLYLEPVDLEHCLHEVMLVLQPTAQQKGLPLIVDFDLFLPTRFIADPGRMRQILTNLIGNAVKFTEKGHVLARVVGMETAEGRYDLHITVEDTGIGIPPDAREHIFGEFNQVEDQSNRKFEGTGLGLAITRQLVELMGGEIWVESELGQGSCFGFRVNLAAAEPRDDDVPGGPILFRHALVVDESLLSRQILCRQIETSGLSVTACRTASEAADLLRSGAIFDLAVLDGDMAGGAAALVSQLREAGLTAPALVAGAAATQINAPDGLGIGGLLQKPILRSDLIRKLQALSRSQIPSPSPLARPLASATGRAMRVLAAEDNKTNQLVFQKMVQDLDIDLTLAANGHEAVALWRDLSPDLIFMDISMPGMDGQEATRLIRSEEAQRRLPRPAVPIVAMTAHAMEGDREMIVRAGINSYLTKPLKKAAILEEIARHAPDEARPPCPKTPRDGREASPQRVGDRTGASPF